MAKSEAEGGGHLFCELFLEGNVRDNREGKDAVRERRGGGVGEGARTGARGGGQGYLAFSRDNLSLAFGESTTS